VLKLDDNDDGNNLAPRSSWIVVQGVASRFFPFKFSEG